MSLALICESFQRTTVLSWIFPQGYRCETTGHEQLGESSPLENLFSRKDIRDELRPAQILAEPVVGELDHVIRVSPPILLKQGLSPLLSVILS